MNKRGFTLIEMLTVLIILSLIALITVSAITSVLKSSKETLYETQKKQIESAARLWGSDNMLILPNDETSTNICVYSDINNCSENYRKLIIDLKMLQDNGYIDKGMENPKTGQRYDNVIIEIEKVGKKLEYTVNISENNYKEEILNGADPVLQSDMIPVTIENNGTVKKADISKKWYNYGNKEWANAVVLIDNTKYNAGDIIPEDKIKAYYVWIPRYKYKLFSSSTPIEINIEFESSYTNKSHGDMTGKWLTHPAFTYGLQEIDGFWVGKFETTGNATTPTIKPYMSGNSNSTIISLRSQNVSTQYATSLNISNNSTMLKNDEWGAIAYLSHSKFGTCIDGACSQVRINNNSGYKTGCGALSDDKASSSSCEIEYGKATSYPQSTTKNITGVFDMSGGAWEYVMGVLADSEGKPYSGRNNVYNSGFNGKFGCPTCDSTTSGVDSSILELTTGTNLPNATNYNLYTTSDPLTACNGKSCLGHAEAETRYWYGDYYVFPSEMGPWVFRGGYYDNDAGAGVFYANKGYGPAGSLTSFRVAIHN